MIAALLLLLLGPLAAVAHPLSPSLLQIDAAADPVEVRWRTPSARPRGAVVAPVLPERCVPAGPTVAEASLGAVEARTPYECGPEGLVGATLSATGLADAGTDVVVDVALPDGRRVRALLTAARPEWVVPPSRGGARVAGDYARLGVHHLWTGADHVLFVLGMLLLVGRLRPGMHAVTAFTVGHSASLALATLGVVRLPSGPVEAAIAGSLVVLAVEVLGERDGRESPLGRHPWAVCAPFGLLHGLGFAGALVETGLPDDGIPAALIGFNLGIEAGQIALVGLALAGAALATRLGADRLPWRAVAGWGGGALAASWMWARWFSG